MPLSSNTVSEFHKDVNEFDETRVHFDYSVISPEFICFLSSIISSRMVKRFDTVESLDGMSYSKSMAVLEGAKKVCIDGKWNLVRLTVKDSEILTNLGFVLKMIEVKNPRGRLRKKKL